eukprot:c23130_g1_i1 orf=733-1371(+)
MIYAINNLFPPDPRPTLICHPSSGLELPLQIVEKIMAGTSLIKPTSNFVVFINSPKKFNENSIRTPLFLDTCKSQRLNFMPKTSRLPLSKCTTIGESAQSSVLCPDLSQRQVPTFYDILGVLRGVSDTEIKDAYRNKVKRYHPDLAPPEKVEEYKKKFIEVRMAYTVLKDEKRRAIYDVHIKNSLYSRNWIFEEKTGQWKGRNWETDQCWTS